MTVLILLNSLSVGGSETKSIKIVNEFRQKNRSTCVAYLSEPAPLLNQIRSDVPVTNLYRSGKFSIRAVRNLRKFIIQHDVSVVLCMNQYPLLYAVAAKVTLPRRLIKIILAVNTTDFERKRDQFFMLLYSPLIRLTKSVIYGCKYQMELWRKKYFLRQAGSIVIYNGVDTNYFDPTGSYGNLRKELGCSSKVLIGCVGRLDSEKNQAALIEAVAGLNMNQHLVLLIVGSGPELPKLEALVDKLDIAEQVHFLGRMADVRPALSAMDIFVLPSMSVETFSNAALEAMAMSLPVLLTNIGGASEMIEDGENGYLYGKNDTQRLTELTLKLVMNPRLRQSVGRKARNSVVSSFNSHRMISDYEKLIDKICEM